MHKILRIFETLAKLLKKPPTATGRRIAMSPFFKNIFLEDEEENFARQKEYYNPHQFYLRQLNYQMSQQQEQKEYIKKSSAGLTDLILPHRMSQHDQIVQSGDYQVGSTDSFLHTIQLNRRGADNYFFSLDDVESVQSHYEQQIDFDMEDSLVFQH